MKEIWVPFDGIRYLAIDKVALSRTAKSLLAVFPQVDTEVVTVLTVPFALFWNVLLRICWMHPSWSAQK